MSTFIVTIADEYEADVHDVCSGIRGWMEAGKDWRLDITVKEVDPVSGGPESHLHAKSLDYVEKDAI